MVRNETEVEASGPSAGHHIFLLQTGMVFI
jgi:hypothetical protein